MSSPRDMVLMGEESDIVKETIEYMPAGGIYISDHRHKFKLLALKVEAL